MCPSGFDTVFSKEFERGVYSSAFKNATDSRFFTQKHCSHSGSRRTNKIRLVSFFYVRPKAFGDCERKLSEGGTEDPFNLLTTAILKQHLLSVVIKTFARPSSFAGRFDISALSKLTRAPLFSSIKNRRQTGLFRHQKDASSNR